MNWDASAEPKVQFDSTPTDWRVKVGLIAAFLLCLALYVKSL